MIIGRRRSRVVGTIWGLVALAFLVAAVLLWLDRRTISFEIPAVVVSAWLARSWWRQQAVLDRHGIHTVAAVSERRVLWAAVERVEVTRPGWWRPAIVLHLKGGAGSIPVPASAGLRRRQRNRLVEFLTDLAHQHGFILALADGTVLAGRPAHRPDPLDDAATPTAALASPVVGPTEGAPGPSDGVTGPEGPASGQVPAAAATEAGAVGDGPGPAGDDHADRRVPAWLRPDADVEGTDASPDPT